LRLTATNATKNFDAVIKKVIKKQQCYHSTQTNHSLETGNCVPLGREPQRLNADAAAADDDDDDNEDNG